MKVWVLGLEAQHNKHNTYLGKHESKIYKTALT